MDIRILRTEQSDDFGSAPFASIDGRYMLPRLLFLIFALSACGTFLMMKLSRRVGMVDVPNSRSSHSVPTPRGGGLAIVASFCIGVYVFVRLGAVRPPFLGALLMGLAVALVGLLDDKYRLSPGIRIVVHTFAGAGAIWAIGVPILELSPGLVFVEWVAGLVALVGLVWLTNLFNFMDGIDGLAAAQAIFVLASASGVILASGGNQGLVFTLLLLAVSCAGFLIFNWPPARIFLGDVGSGSLGFLIGVMALYSLGTTACTVWTWFILCGAFMADGTTTLLRRFFAGEKWYSAHRSHAYQHLARRWGGHRPALIAYSLLNLLWFLPAAWATVIWPRYGFPIAVVSVGAAAGIFAVIGSGKSDAN